jgi:hypothetical protein
MPAGKDLKKVTTNRRLVITPVNQSSLSKNVPGGDVTNKDQKDYPLDYYRDGRVVEVPDKDPKNPPKKILMPEPRQIETLGATSNYKKENLCTIRAITGTGAVDKDGNLTSPRKNAVPPYLKFFLTGVDAPRSERYQVVETFGDWYIFFYGERPPVYTFTGVLLNTPNYNWLNEFDFFYDAFLRGTAATRNVTRIFITYGFQQVQGHLLDFAHSIRADNDMAVQFQLRMAVVKRFALTPDNGNRATDSFISNLETITAFQKILDDSGKNSKYNYSMLKNIMDAKQPPANADAKARAEDTKKLVAQIEKDGLKTYKAGELV